MDFRDKKTGIIYKVTNEALIPQYTKSERFEVIKEKKPEAKKTAKK